MYIFMYVCVYKCVSQCDVIVFLQNHSYEQDEVYYSDTDGRALSRIGELTSASGRRAPIGGKHVRGASSSCLSLLTPPSRRSPRLIPEELTAALPFLFTRFIV